MIIDHVKRTLRLLDELERFHARFWGIYRRQETREFGLKYLRGLMGSVERKNSWQMAEALGVSDYGSAAGDPRRDGVASQSDRDVLANFRRKIAGAGCSTAPLEAVKKSSPPRSRPLPADQGCCRCPVRRPGWAMPSGPGSSADCRGGWVTNVRRRLARCWRPTWWRPSAPRSTSCVGGAFSIGSPRPTVRRGARR